MVADISKASSPKEAPTVEVARHPGSCTPSFDKESGRRPVADDAAFDTTEDPRYYKPIPTYEGIHRWDPDFEWDEEEERKIVRKVMHSSDPEEAPGLTATDRPARLHIRVLHLLRPAAGPRKQCPGQFRQHAPRPGHDHQRL